MDTGTAGEAKTTSAGSTTCLCAALIWSAQAFSSYLHPHFEPFLLCSWCASLEMPVKTPINTKCPQSSIQTAVDMPRVHKMNWVNQTGCSLKKHISQWKKTVIENKSSALEDCVVVVILNRA